jgi:predicted nuclease with TOPRIM domain
LAKKEVTVAELFERLGRLEHRVQALEARFAEVMDDQDDALAIAAAWREQGDERLESWEDVKRRPGLRAV